jgi:hypothetical protein
MVTAKKAANPIPNNASFGISTLTLANGMTAGYGVDDGHMRNPVAAPNTYGGNPKWSTQRIGVLRNLPGNNVNNNGNYALYFIFNPNEVAVSFAMSTSVAPPIYAYTNTSTGTAQGTAAAAYIGNQSVSWSLIFDRTYDMWKDSTSRGVLTDVAALYNVLGTFQTQGAVPVSNPVQVVFGRNGKGDATTGSGQLWGFTGFITYAVVTYGIFRYNMIPSRCEVDLTMTAAYVGSTPSGTGGGNSGKTPAVTQGPPLLGSTSVLGLAPKNGGPPKLSLTTGKSG